jgi:hypothetical protein
MDCDCRPGTRVYKAEIESCANRRNSMNRYLVVLVTALVVPVSLAAQDPGARIRAAEARTAAAGIPVSLLEMRVAEGKAKGIPMDRIASVVERRATSLLDAKAAMDPASTRLTAAELGAGADALERGIDGRSLRTVIQEARSEDRAVAIAVLTYLHGEGGLPVDRALARVTQALKKGPGALRDLPAQAAAERASQGRGGPGANPGRGRGQGPPEGVPARGSKPGSGKPVGVGKGRGNGNGRGKNPL